MADYQLGDRRLRTAGRPMRGGLLADEKVIGKRLPKELWAQLDAITRGGYVNHLGRGHRRNWRGE